MFRVVKIRSGFNPNSSSLSVNMVALLAATGVVTLGTFVVAAAVRLFRRAPRDKNTTPPPANPSIEVP